MLFFKRISSGTRIAWCSCEPKVATVIDTNPTLEQIVTANPGAAEVFVRHGLDFCYRGQRSLDEACKEAGIDVRTVAAELSAVRSDSPDERGWSDRPLAEIVDHIIERYHDTLRRDLPLLIALARKVEETHADRPTRPVGLAEQLERIHAAVENHLTKEEGILFPLIRAGRGDTTYVPINLMTREHEDHGESLRRMRALAHDFVAPEDAGASWHQLYRSLARLEAEFWRHIHLENYVLFPRALQAAGFISQDSTGTTIRSTR